MAQAASLRLKTAFTFLACLVVWAASSPAVGAAPLRAGTAVQDITGEDPAVVVHDRLHARALVLDDGNTQAAIVCLDLGGASSSLVADVRKRVREAVGMDGANVLISASHNHHAGGQLPRDLTERIAKAVRQAFESRAPVRIGVGVGREDRIMMNRRLRLKNGKHWTIRRATPSPRDEDVAALGPIDPEIGILRLDRADGRTLAVLYNYAGHAYGGTPDRGVTADFPGFASAVLEQALGHGAVALFVQGAAGDITPIRYKDVDAPQPTEQLGVALGLSTLKALAQIPVREEASLQVVAETVAIPRRRDVEAHVASLEEQEKEILEYFTGVGCGAHGAGTFLNFKSFLPLYMKYAVDPVHPSYYSWLYEHEAATGQKGLQQLDVENRQRVDKYLECIRRMEQLIRIRTNLQMVKQHLTRGADGDLEVEVQGLRIGEFVLVTFPGEPFAEVALRIKEQSPFAYTFVAGYANGHLGYGPTADAYKSEDYEDCLTPFGPEWQGIYEKKALEIIRRLAAAKQ